MPIVLLRVSFRFVLWQVVEFNPTLLKADLYAYAIYNKFSPTHLFCCFIFFVVWSSPIMRIIYQVIKHRQLTLYNYNQKELLGFEGSPKNKKLSYVLQGEGFDRVNNERMKFRTFILFYEERCKKETVTDTLNCNATEVSRPLEEHRL